MKRYYYGREISQFIEEDELIIYGSLSKNHQHDLEGLQKKAWLEQIQILKTQLKEIKRGFIFLEFIIPRMGKRADAVIVIGDFIFVLEFKVGEKAYHKHSLNQAIDYAVDLKNFHEGSHTQKIVPVLIATEARSFPIKFESYPDKVFYPIKINKDQICELLGSDEIQYLNLINPVEWAESRYKPTPTIIEAAQALYQNHEVDEITRSDAGAINLSITTTCLNKIIDRSKLNNRKTICFVTGVPGAGKTLAGLNLAIQRKNIDEDEHAVFLSGNGPLVDVLREALARDEVIRGKEEQKKVVKEEQKRITKEDAKRKASSFIQNIHHFRNDSLSSEKPPVEKVVVFDEAQRAWDEKQTTRFMKERGEWGFSMSEPEFLISIMNRHENSCTIICLIGGGQEINTGEAGLGEWFRALQKSFNNWDVHYSELILTDNNYLNDDNIIRWIQNNGMPEKNLHLGVSIRSFRSEQLSEFVKKCLDLNFEKAQLIYENDIRKNYPLYVTRNLETAKKWLQNQARGTERYGLVASSGGVRLRPFGINVKSKIDAPNWFLNDKDDIRSSYFMEEVATEFDIQGLELDWIGLCWDGDLYINPDGDWECQDFTGTTWKTIHVELKRDYLKNAYRVLMTRARQGMIIFIPNGSEDDKSRLFKYYDGTFEYFKSLGIMEVK